MYINLDQNHNCNNPRVLTQVKNDTDISKVRNRKSSQMSIRVRSWDIQNVDKAKRGKLTPSSVSSQLNEDLKSFVARRKRTG